MSAGSSIADALRPMLPRAWSIKGYEDDVDQIRAPQVQVILNEVTKTPGVRLGSRDYTLIVRVLSPVTDPAKRDDALEDALDVVLKAIENLTPARTIRWTGATFQVLADLPAYDISVVVTAPHTYQQ